MSAEGFNVCGEEECASWVLLLENNQIAGKILNLYFAVLYTAARTSVEIFSAATIRHAVLTQADHQFHNNN